MGGIVIELQREALDEKNSIESLIRKAYLVAKKLKLKLPTPYRCVEP